MLNILNKDMVFNSKQTEYEIVLDISSNEGFLLFKKLFDFLGYFLSCNYKFQTNGKNFPKFKILIYNHGLLKKDELDLLVFVCCRSRRINIAIGLMDDSSLLHDIDMYNTLKANSFLLF